MAPILPFPACLDYLPEIIKFLPANFTPNSWTVYPCTNTYKFHPSSSSLICEECPKWSGSEFWLFEDPRRSIEESDESVAVHTLNIMHNIEKVKLDNLISICIWKLSGNAQLYSTFQKLLSTRIEMKRWCWHRKLESLRKTCPWKNSGCYKNVNVTHYTAICLKDFFFRKSCITWKCSVLENR